MLVSVSIAFDNLIDDLFYICVFIAIPALKFELQKNISFSYDYLWEIIYYVQSKSFLLLAKLVIT